MKLLRAYAFLGLLSYVTQAQELPPVENFFPFDYGAGNQNWAISQSPDRLIFIANNNGLLEFNGASWHLYPSPNETIMRSVKVISDKIYTGCYMDFGFWKRNDLGGLEYTSLSQRLNLKLLDDEEFWNIVGIERWVVFQSLNRIYIYDSHDQSVNIIESQGIINKMFVVDGTIYFQRLNEGIYRILNGIESPFIDNATIRASEVINLFGDDDKMVILTKHQGFFSYEDGKLISWGDHNEELSKLSIYSAIQLKNNHYALGTISHGLVYYGSAEGIIYEICQSKGIQNNTVLSVFEDLDGNIWAGLDNGISYVNIDAPINIYNDENGSLGSVYASAYLNDTLYLGTNQGLYYKPMYSKGEFTFINGTQGQVWSLTRIDNELFCGHHRGTFIVQGDKVMKIDDTEGTWSIKQLDGERDLLIQGNYDGLYILKRSQNNRRQVRRRWQVRNKVDGFGNSARSFEVAQDKIFVNHEYKGVFELTVDSDFTEIKHIKLDTTLKGANSSIAKFKNNILFAYHDGILRYDQTNDQFIKDTLLSNIYTDENYISGKIIPSRTNDRFWTFTKDNVTVVTSGQLSETPVIRSIPLNLQIRRDVIEYENITGINGGDTYLLGTSFGYVMFNHEDFSTDDFEVKIGSISNGINSDHSASGFLLDKSQTGEFGTNENNLLIDFYSPTYYKYLKPVYQFQLEGIYDSWSEWETQSNVFFENLPPGSYTFNVRAKLGEQLSSNVASYTFKIAKPWYASEVMIAIYLIGIVIISLLTHYTYRRYYHRQRQKLIEQNERDLEFARLQNEKEIIKIKNEQLTQDFKSKSNELAASIMSMAKNNELLEEIQQHLSKVSDQESLAPVSALIDRNLNKEENWEFFKEAFDSTDNEFFKKLKNQHPELSPSDLKLCAYLRLNLSSKDIAQLSNISPKSVEIKRYRLRKKLNLNGNQNLINYILNV